MAGSPVAGKYDTTKDRESAYEVLSARSDAAAREAEEAERREEEAEAVEREYRTGRRYKGERVGRSTSRRTTKSDGFGEALTKVFVKELKGTTGRRIIRGILGGIFKGR
jgi:hypothetical protein